MFTKICKKVSWHIIDNELERIIFTISLEDASSIVTE